MSTESIRLGENGTLFIPDELRQRYQLRQGVVFTLVELGDGAFLLSPFKSRIAELGDKVAEVMEQEGVTLEDLLTTLDEERKRRADRRITESGKAEA